MEFRTGGWTSSGVQGRLGSGGERVLVRVLVEGAWEEMMMGEIDD